MTWRSIPFITLMVLGALMAAAFLGHLWLRGLHRFPDAPRWEIPEADPSQGKLVIMQSGCASCHVIPGVRKATGRVGPKLEDFRNQVFIAGMIPNTPENLIRWIQYPQEISPGSAMPNLGLTEQEARDVAAYLYANP